MSPADGRDAGLRKAEVQNLALSDRLFDRAGDVLDRDVRIDAMLVEKIDDVVSPSRLGIRCSEKSRIQCFQCSRIAPKMFAGSALSATLRGTISEGARSW
jgi:hypothetical protein